MTLVNLLSELLAERKRLDQAIQEIESLIQAGGKRRGRPPKLAGQPSVAGALSRKIARTDLQVNGKVGEEVLDSVSSTDPGSE